MPKRFGGKENWFMSRSEKVSELIGEFSKTETILNKIWAFHDEFLNGDLVKLGKGKSAGIVMAEIYTDYYTSMETLFFRISQTFENHLSKERWHSDLLHKMSLDVPSVRRPVLSDETVTILEEFLRFRHFKRYYFQSEYDWDRLDYLEKKYQTSIPLLRSDFNVFKVFLDELAKN